MPVPEGLVGRYIQVVAKMRYGADGGDSVRHVESARPFSTVRGRRVFHDGGPDGDKSVNEEPTYVYFEADDNINLPDRIAAGGVIAAPVAKRATTRRATDK